MFISLIKILALVFLASIGIATIINELVPDNGPIGIAGQIVSSTILTLLVYFKIRPESKKQDDGVAK